MFKHTAVKVASQIPNYYVPSYAAHPVHRSRSAHHDAAGRGGGADRRVTTRSIAVGANASENHIAKAVARLGDLGMVSARRGRVGGLALTEAGRTVSIGWLVRRLEGDREVIECGGANPCPLTPACRLRRVLAEAKEAFYRELDRYTLNDLTRDAGILVLPEPTLPVGRQAEGQPTERIAR